MAEIKYDMYCDNKLEWQQCGTMFSSIDDVVSTNTLLHPEAVIVRWPDKAEIIYKNLRLVYYEVKNG